MFGFFCFFFKRDLAERAAEILRKITSLFYKLTLRNQNMARLDHDLIR